MGYIVQADRHHDFFTERLLQTGTVPYELQLFQDGEDAWAWLREQVA